MRPILSILVLSIFLSSFETISAQINNNCSGAILIADPANFCSPVQSGSNAGATGSAQPASQCFQSGTRDVWYRFKAVATEATIVINGNSQLTPGGSLSEPVVALYKGSCGSLTELGCKEDNGFFISANVVELRYSGLTPGEEYFVRVGSASFLFNTGTFQYCIRNYNFGGGVSGDCPTAIVLCDKVNFNVQAVTGPGSNASEMDDATCFNDTDIEQNTTWYVFTAANNGTLEFTLNANNPDDDLDFALYELPNGPSNCSGKKLLRCMAAGNDEVTMKDCTGPTGLNSTSTDLSEPAGCPSTSDGFVRFLNMTAGTTYALAINNYSSSGNGFEITWGGTGQFRGPRPGIRSNDPDNKVCLGQTLTLSDSTTTNGSVLTRYEWNFGVGANVATATGAGPHNITYQSPGAKIITLKVKTATGCEVATTRNIEVINCCSLTPKVSVSDTTLCRSKATVAAPGAVGALKINWSTGQTNAPFALFNTSGTYSVTVEDANGCTGTASFTVTLPTPPRAVVTAIPGCTTATATLNIQGGTAPFVVRWSNGQAGLSVTNLTNGNYTVFVTDAKGCADTSVFNVLLPPAFEVGITPNIVCADGPLNTLTATTANGTTPYTFRWSTGQTSMQVTGVQAGIYTLTGTDANGCSDTTTLTVTTPPALSAAVVTTPGCRNNTGAFAEVTITNGQQPYTYNWSNGQVSAVANNLTIGNYTLIVTDAKGCRDTAAFEVKGPILFTATFPKDTTIVAGGTATLTVSSSSAGISVLWEGDGQRLTGSQIKVSPTKTTTYAVDASLGNCLLSDSVKVTVIFDFFEVPNAFTPDGDQVNDQFGPVLSGYEQTGLQVWTRWGELIFNEPTARWDGTINGLPAPTDVYIYRVQVRKRDGKDDEKTGQVYLLR